MANSSSTGGPWDMSPWHLVCPCNTVSDFPERCPYHSPPTIATWPSIPAGTGWVTLTPAPSELQRLSDEDVDRIAEAVARRLNPPPPRDTDVED